MANYTPRVSVLVKRLGLWSQNLSSNFEKITTLPHGRLFMPHQVMMTSGLNSSPIKGENRPKVMGEFLSE